MRASTATLRRLGRDLGLDRLESARDDPQHDRSGGSCTSARPSPADVPIQVQVSCQGTSTRAFAIGVPSFADNGDRELARRGDLDVAEIPAVREIVCRQR